MRWCFDKAQWEESECVRQKSSAPRRCTLHSPICLPGQLIVTKRVSFSVLKRKQFSDGRRGPIILHVKQTCLCLCQRSSIITSEPFLLEVVLFWQLLDDERHVFWTGFWDPACKFTIVGIASIWRSPVVEDDQVCICRFWCSFCGRWIHTRGGWWVYFCGCARAWAWGCFCECGGVFIGFDRRRWSLFLLLTIYVDFFILMLSW